MSKRNIECLQHFLDHECTVKQYREVIAILSHYGFSKDFDKDYTLNELVEHCLFDLRSEHN